MTANLSSHLWTQAALSQAKEDCRSKLQSLAKIGPSAQWKYLLQTISQLADDPDVLAPLRRYVTCVSCLIMHERHAGLSASQVRHVTDIATGILKAEKIKPTSATFAFLYSDVFSVSGQIARRSGQHWQASWQQLCAVKAASASGGGDAEGFRNFVLANRLLRLGHANLASQRLVEAQALSQGRESWHLRAKLLRINLFRQNGDYLEAREAIDVFMEKEPNLEEGFLQELAWERICIQYLESRDPELILKAIGTRGSHRSGSYLLEGVLWLLCHAQKKVLVMVPKVAHLGHDRRLALKRQKRLWECVRIIQEGYDTDIPLAIRLSRMGRVLTLAPQLFSVDKEILVWAAVTRWLMRVKAHDLAQISRAEYEAINLRLSMGEHSDIWNLLIFTGKSAD